MSDTQLPQTLVDVEGRFDHGSSLCHLSDTNALLWTINRLIGVGAVSGPVEPVIREEFVCANYSACSTLLWGGAGKEITGLPVFRRQESHLPSDDRWYGAVRRDG